MTRDLARRRLARPAAGFLGASLLLLAHPLAAEVSEQDAPASAWQNAAELALERGDCERALTIYEKQVERKSADVVGPLGDLYEGGRCAHLDLPPALELYRRLIAMGIPLAQARLGYLYLEGLGVRQDVVRAERLFKKAVLEVAGWDDAPEARRRVMASIMGRHPVPPELQAELDWVDRIEHGPTRLLYETALKLKDGIGLPKHAGAAEDWLRRAAIDRGYAPAYYALGMWQLARACDQEDRRIAFDHIARAATLGHPQAIKEMGLRLAEGRGVRRYDFGAMVLLLRAARAGENVETTLREVTSRLNHHERVVAGRWAEKEDRTVTYSLAASERQPQPSSALACRISRHSS